METELPDQETFQEKVLDRDGQCVYCGHPGSTLNILGAHHINPSSNGGGDTLENGVTLCENHHAAIHSVGDRPEYPVEVLEDSTVPEKIPEKAPLNSFQTVLVFDVFREEYQPNQRLIRDITGLERQRVNELLTALENAGWIEKRCRGLYRLVYDGEGYVKQEIV